MTAAAKTATQPTDSRTAHRFRVPLAPADHDRLEERARLTGLSPSQLVTTLVVRALHREPAQP